MANERTEKIRNEILFQGYSARPAARSADRMATQARRDGELYDATEREFEVECEYLVGRGLLEARTGLHAGMKRYALTSAGIDFHEAQN